MLPSQLSPFREEAALVENIRREFTDLKGLTSEIPEVNEILLSQNADYGYAVFIQKGHGALFFTGVESPHKKIYFDLSHEYIIQGDDVTFSILLHPYFKTYQFWFCIIDLIICLLIFGSIILINKYIINHRRLRIKLKEILHKNQFMQVSDKLSLKLVFVNVFSGIFAIFCFMFMYQNRYAFLEFLNLTEINRFDFEPYVAYVQEKVKDLTLTESNIPKINKIMNSHNDSSFSSYIYNEEQNFSVGSRVMGGGTIENLNAEPYNVTEVKFPLYSSFQLQFKDKTAQLEIYSYPLLGYVYPLLVIMVLMSISFYLIPVLTFVNKKVKEIKSIQKDIMVLSNGDLGRIIKVEGNDEIAQLSNDLNQMRIVLNENIQNEALSRKNNNDLITSMSHDLRTPLTALSGFLEILKYKKYRDESEYEKCIERSLVKVEEIKEMTSNMLEYALVFSDQDAVILNPYPISYIIEYLESSIENIEMKGFKTSYQCIDSQSTIQVNEQMIKRIFNNLFSNILKYANAEYNVIITLSIEKGFFYIKLSNVKKTGIDIIERNFIGLKSVEKMMRSHLGELEVINQDSLFIVILKFPVL